MRTASDLCQTLEWDSTFFKIKIAQVTKNRLSHEDMNQVITWCRNNKIECLYLLDDSDHAETTRLAEDNLFRLVDIRVTLEMTLRSISTVQGVFQGAVRLSMPQDVPALRAIARTSYHDSRFYYDQNFPRPLCDALYETWIEKSCHGYADSVLVAELSGRPVGYISCHLLGQRKGKIGLIGVVSDSQGKGIGQRLISESLRWFSMQGVEHVTVVTQGRNRRAQSSYQRCGFITRSVQLWYHKWFGAIGGMAPE